MMARQAHGSQLARGVPKSRAIEELEDLDFRGKCCVIGRRIFMHAWT
jgi:hypothetical protein